MESLWGYYNPHKLRIDSERKGRSSMKLKKVCLGRTVLLLFAVALAECTGISPGFNI